MAAEASSATKTVGFWTRLGSLIIAPRQLARRDLRRHDGKAGDDLIALVGVAVVVNGASSLVRAVLSLAAGRTNAALHQLAGTVRAILPLVIVWLVATVLLWAFTLRSGKRAVGELGARVTSIVVLASLVLRPLVTHLDPSPLRYALESLPWALGAVWFGLQLREALEPQLLDDAPEQPFPRNALVAGGLVGLVLVGVAFTQLGTAYDAQADAQGITARTGSVAPAIDLPLLTPTDGSSRFTLASVRGRPVVVSFWATWCGPCLRELPVLEKIYRQRGSDAPLVYLVNVDEAGPDREQAVQGVRARLQLTMPIVLDDGSASRDYSISTIPSLAKIDAQGTLQALHDRPLDEADLRDLLR